MVLTNKLEATHEVNVQLTAQLKTSFPAPAR
jgi:hypothetical protein